MSLRRRGGNDTAFDMRANPGPLHSLILRGQLPVHGEGEAEQAARIPALRLDVVGVQVESRQPPASQEKGEQPQPAGVAVRHVFRTSAKTLPVVTGKGGRKGESFSGGGAVLDWLTAPGLTVVHPACSCSSHRPPGADPHPHAPAPSPRVHRFSYAHLV